MKLLTQPGDSVTPLVKGIENAKKSVEIFIFRFDRGEIERALVTAASNGVYVHALIAYTNRGGEKHLRELESRLLAAGVTVSRTADDLIRYHCKFMLIDRRELYLLGFNYTYLDMEHSRSFAIITKDSKTVAEAGKLFDADTKRIEYEAGLSTLVVSPVNARKELTEYIKGAKKQLLIWDPKVADPSMIQLLEERVKAGVDVKIIGTLVRGDGKLSSRKMKMRLHTRTILRDRQHVFLGSQSLRTAELDARRELGIIFRDAKIAGSLQKTFEDDWEHAVPVSEATAPVAKMAKRIAKAVAKELPPVAPALEIAVHEMSASMEVQIDTETLEETVRDAVKEAIQEAVKDAVEEAVDQSV